MTPTPHWALSASSNLRADHVACSCGYAGPDLPGHFRDSRNEHEAAVIAPMPNKPKTPMHSFRVEDELWEAAKKRAEERGETLTEALRKFLRRYTK